MPGPVPATPLGTGWLDGRRSFQPDVRHAIALVPQDRVNQLVARFGFVLGHRSRQYRTAEFVLNSQPQDAVRYVEAILRRGSNQLSEPTPTKGNEEFAAYLEYNRILRAWFVAFGIGGPALFLINRPIGERLAENGQLQAVAAMFLIGAGSQVLGAMLNKIGNW